MMPPPRRGRSQQDTFLLDRLRTIAGDGEVYVSDLSGSATVVVQVPASDRPSAERLEREVRLRAYEVLRAEGVYA